MENPFHLLFFKTILGQRRLIRPLFEAEGLSPGQPKVIFYLYHTDGCIQRELADICAIEPATMSKLLDGMEAQGLIQRSATEDCRRSARINLTEKGRALYGKVIEIYTGIERLEHRGFNNREWALFRTFLGRLYQNLTGEELEPQTQLSQSPKERE